MSDFASLVLAVDTRDMARGQQILDSFARKAKTTETAVVTMSDHIRGAAMQAAGALAGMVAGYVSLAAIKGAVDQARNFNAALAETSTLIKGTPAELAALSGSARDLAKAFGTDATSQMQAFYEALSGGAASVAEAQVLVEQANKLALGGVTSVQTAVDALTTSVNAYGAANLSFAGASDAMFVAVLAGKMTMDQLAASLGTIVPISSAAGVSFDETTAAIAALTTQGLTASTASTSLRAVMAAIVAPTEQAKKAAAALGLEFNTQALRAKGLAGFLSDVVAKTNGNQEAMAQLFGSVEALGAVFAFSGGAGDKFNEILGMMATKTGATDAAAAKMAESFDNRLKRAIAALSDIALSLGEIILPVIVTALEAAAAAALILASNSDVLAVAVGAMGIAFLSTLIPAAYAAITAFALNAGAAIALAAEFGVATVAAELFGAALLLTNPVGWVIGIGLAAGAIYGIATASGQAATAAGIQAAAARELDAALKGVNLQTEGGTIKAKNLAQAMLDAARAEVLAARIKMANAQAELNMAGPGLASKGPSIAAMNAQKELDAIMARMAGILAEADKLGLALSKTPMELERAKAAAAATAAEMHRLQVEAGASNTAIAATTAAANDLLLSTAERIKLEKLAWIYGDGSRQVAQAKHDIEMASLVTQMEAANVADATVKSIIDQANASFEMQQALNGASGYAGILYAKLSYLASAISPAIGAAWQLVAALGAAIGRIGSVAAGLARVAGISGAMEKIGGALGKGFGVVAGAFGGAAKTLGTYWEASKKAVASGKELSEVLAGSGGKGGGGVAGGAKAAKEELTEAEKAAKQYADTMSGYVTDGIGKAVDWMVSGFKGGLKGLLDIFKSTISQMISYALKNKIMIALGMGGTGAAGAATAAVTGGAKAGAGGGLSGILSGIAGVGTAFFSGASGLLTALTGAGGGLAAAGTYMSSVLGGATASLTGFAAAAGAIALPLAAVAAVFSFFKTKTTQLDAGLRLTINGLETAVETFSRVKRTKFWGLSSSTRTTYAAASDSVADPISRAIGEMQAGIIETAGILGIGSAAFNAFAKQLQISTQGLSESDALAAVQKAILGLGDDFASLATGIGDFTRDGEGAMAALTRLSQALTAVNLMADTLGLTFRAVGLIGADMASQLSDVFGGLDALNTAVGNYYSKFYTEAERNATATRQAAEALAKLNASMPQSRDEYRAMVEAQDLTTESGRALFAALVSLSGVMDQVLPQVGSLTAAIAAIVGDVQTGLGAMITATQDAQSRALAAAEAWRDTAKTLRRYIGDMRGRTSALTSASAALVFNEAQFRALLAQALGGNLEAAGQLTGAADALISSAGENATTTQEAARAQAAVLAGLTQVADSADTTGSAMDALAALLGEQLTVLQTISDYLAAGGVDATHIQGLTDSLAALQGPIAGVGALDLTAQLAAPMATLGAGLASLVFAIQDDIKDRAARAAADASAQAAAQVEAARLAALAEADRLAAVAAADAATAAAEREAARLAAIAASQSAYERWFGNGNEGRPPIGWDATGFSTFAAGGDHKGGLRIVGENGPELEATGPSRIFTAAQTKAMLKGGNASGGFAEVVDELRNLRKQVEGLQEQERQMQAQILSDGRRERKIIEAWEATGMPPARAAL